MLRKTLALASFAVFSLLLLGAGCSPKPGTACKQGEDRSSCTDKATQLACIDSQWLAAPCRGPAGCTSDGRSASCDTSLASEADGCDTDGRYSCTTDKKAQLRCKAHKWTVVDHCLGPSGCDASGMFVKCDTNIARDGDICEIDEKDATKKRYSCTEDKKSMLLCKEGKWKTIEQCTGAAGCSVAGFMARCDGPTAKVGDLCDHGDKEDYACSADKKARLKCASDAWQLDRTCLGQKGCSASLGIDCDTSIVEPGEACAKDGSAACSTDGKTILECKQGKFEKSRECTKACKANSLFVSCDD